VSGDRETGNTVASVQIPATWLHCSGTWSEPTVSVVIRQRGCLDPEFYFSDKEVKN